MIPPRELLETVCAGTGKEQEPGYTEDELKVLEEARKKLVGFSPDERDDWGRRLLRALWPDELTYIRKTHVIKTKRPGEVVLFKPNYAQRRFYQDVIVKCREAFKPIRAVILKARQLGFSSFMQCWQYEMCESNPNRTALTVSYDDASTTELFQKAEFVRRHQWFPHPDHRSRKGLLLELTNGSTFFSKTAGNTAAGRSQTWHHVHLSEIPMWPDAEETFAGILSAVPIDPDTSVVLESTARGTVGAFFREWKAAENGESEYVPFFAPWFWDPEYQLAFPSDSNRGEFARSLDLEERRLEERHKLTLEQLHWRRWKIRSELQGSVLKFHQEFPSTASEAFLSTGSPVFDATAIAELDHNARDPLWIGTISLKKDPLTPDLLKSPAGQLRIWDDPKDATAYVVGADVAEGRVRDKTLSAKRKLHSYSDSKPDYSAACVIELETGLHVASWHGHINPFDFAAVCYALGAYYNNALLVVEVNGPGISTVTALAEQLHYPKLYRSRQYAVLERAELAHQFGWRTLPQTREHLMFRVTEALGVGNLFTRDRKLIDELRTMQRDDNGNPRARGTDKDDRVFAFALALQGRYDVFGGRQPAPDVRRNRHPDAKVWEYVKSKQGGIHAGSSLRHPRYPGRPPRPGYGFRL